MTNSQELWRFQPLTDDAMSFITPILDGTTEILGDMLAYLLKAIDPGTGWFDDAADGGLGMVVSGLAGVAAALLVAILLSLYFRTGYRSTRDIVKHGLATALVLALIAFVVYDVRHAALAYLGIDPSTSAIEFEISLPRTAL